MPHQATAGDVPRRYERTLQASSRLPRQSAPGTAGDVPDRHRVFGDLVQDPIPANPQPPQVRRPIREGPGWSGIVSQLVDSVQDRAYALRVVEERGRLVDRPFVVVDPQAHRGMPSRRLASSADTNVAWPVASRALHSSTAAVSSASSSSCGVAACSSARRRRKSATGTTTAAWPPRWITSYEPVSGPGMSGWAVISLPPVVISEGLLPILAGSRAHLHDVGTSGGPVSRWRPQDPGAEVRCAVFRTLA